jgi:hypothetical protein
MSEESQTLIREVIDLIPAATTEQLKGLEHKMSVEQALQGLTRNYEIAKAATQILKAVRKELNRRGVE